MAEILKVHELLATGRDNARTGRELADAEELEAYRQKLSKREHELHRTGEALAQCQI